MTTTKSKLFIAEIITITENISYVVTAKSKPSLISRGRGPLQVLVLFFRSFHLIFYNTNWLDNIFR